MCLGSVTIELKDYNNTINTDFANGFSFYSKAAIKKQDRLLSRQLTARDLPGTIRKMFITLMTSYGSVTRSFDLDQRK